MKKLNNLVHDKLWLAPLAGFTDFSFRSIAKECGADVILSEMVSADGLVYDDAKTSAYMKFSEMQRPFGIQLFGSDPFIFEKAMRIAMEKNPDFIDINMGCPVRKVVQRNAGSALMKNIDLAQKIVEVSAKVLQHSDIPLTVKYRAGWDFQTINAVEYGVRMQNAGADLLCLHPRTRSQMFSGHSNWDFIKAVKEAVAIPVIGNGDVYSYDDAHLMKQKTNCDGIMIGRGAIGNPWIFATIKAAGKVLFTNEQKFDVLKRHFHYSIEEKGETRAIREMRSHIGYYTKGMRGGSKVRNFINKTTDFNDIMDAVRDLYETSQ